MLRSITLQVHENIETDKALDLNSQSDFLLDTICSQWGFAGVTTGENINMAGVARAYSIGPLNKDIPFPPEFGAFVLDPELGGSTFQNTLN